MKFVIFFICKLVIGVILVYLSDYIDILLLLIAYVFLNFVLYCKIYLDTGAGTLL